MGCLKDFYVRNFNKNRLSRIKVTTEKIEINSVIAA